MRPAEIKAIITKMNDDSWHARDLDQTYAAYADEIVFHRPPFPTVAGKQANRASDEATLAAFSDVLCAIHEIVVEGDTAMAHWTWEGDHTGASPGLGVPATGKRVRFSGCSVYHFRAGKIVEQWEFGDLLGFLQQLGVVPAFG